MASQFYVAEKLKAGNITLEGSEYHHLARVLRLQVRDTVRLFDGTGTLATAEITAISRTAATLNVGQPYEAPVDLAPELTVAVALPKLQRSGWLIEKCVELGVSKFIPLATEHAVVHPRESKLDNLRELIIQASKQCGRAKLMQIADVTPWKEFVTHEFGKQPVVVAHPGGAPFNESLIKELCFQAMTQGRQGELLLAVGPEGGFSRDEITNAMTSGGSLVSLGSRILRVETAAVVMASIFLGAYLGK